ncbi:hypothetical protein R1538_05220 [Rhizobium leguminosarum]|uniref:hypothetical protein n=1 Tax=Rhizobium TaxID=379 RepID=UPI0013B5DC0C|nr:MULTISPECIES: hypothetical protein [Rhizobium]MDV4160520.1 hypothetical protein [Rhizobium leguminosarum]MDV4170249.1 hypothetical protein [Rhizobium leguminosarum]NEJ06875.1 hypothetical protein [Rhizobium ruizarguesonis]QND19114.1 hypothetical protein HB774_01805 [Rhizobium leguminosarum bv. viciae]
MEIKERLGPLTKALGLQHRLGMGHCDDVCLFFERKDENGVVWRAPVSFTFPPSSYTGQKGITWEHVRIGLVETVAEPIGTNGWVSFVGFPNLEGMLVGPEGSIPTWDVAFDEAAEYLREYPLVPEEINLPGIVDEADLAEVWQKLQAMCRARGVEQIEVQRNADSDESYHFQYEGSRVEIRYSGDDAHFLINEELSSTAPSHDLRKVLFELEESFQRIEHRRSGKPAP